MNRYVANIAIISLSAILFLFTSSILASGGEPYYEPGEIVPSPVPVEVVKRAVMEDLWSPYIDCDLFPIYDENDIPVEYLVLMYTEDTKRFDSMWEIIEWIEPYFDKWRAIDLERVAFEIEQSEFWVSHRGLLSKEEEREKKREFLIKATEIKERLKEAWCELIDYGKYGYGFFRGVYELYPGFTTGLHSGCIPPLFIFYKEALEKVKEEYGTDDVEFVCLRSFGYGSRGWEFRADNKRIYASVILLGEGRKPRGRIYIKEITPDMISPYWEHYRPKEMNKDAWEKYGGE